MDLDSLLDDFALRSFRDQADDDYISARMSIRAALVAPSLWASQQMVEKYLKCILLLNRVDGRHVRHGLLVAFAAIERSGKLKLGLTPMTRSFIEYLDSFGKYRYLEISNAVSGRSLVMLDRTAWELRRFCSPDSTVKQLKLGQGVLPPKYSLRGGHLEAIIDEPNNPARQPLLWRNAFFGRRLRRVPVDSWFKATNAPLYLNPQILDEVLRYVYLPKDIIRAYRLTRGSGQSSRLYV
jgi:HEPN domain-containing protein